MKTKQLKPLVETCALNFPKPNCYTSGLLRVFSVALTQNPHPPHVLSGFNQR